MLESLEFDKKNKIRKIKSMQHVLVALQ